MGQFLKKNVILILIFLFFVPLFYFAKAETVSESSAKLKSDNNITVENHFFIKIKAIENVFVKYQSPLVSSVNQFIYVCQKYQLDCYLLPAIAGLESTFGRFVYPQSFNPFGWGGGYVMFRDWNESIEAVGKGIREHYLNKGAKTEDEIGIIYSESSTWAQRVKFLKEIFINEEKRLEYLFTNKILSL